jgi:hypothetical protein
MKLNWKHFVMSVFIVGAALLKFGVPVFPVVAGVLAAGTIGVLRYRKAG